MTGFGVITFLLFVAMHGYMHVKAHNITLTISGTEVYLSQFGYKVCDNSQMKFHLKAAYHTDIVLSSDQSTTSQKYKIGINQGEASITHNTIKSTHQSIGSLIKGDEYKPFWLSWANGDVIFGKGLVVGEDVLLSKAKDPNYLITNISVYNNDVAAGYLIIENNCATSETNQVGKQWTSSLVMKAVNITDNVIWRQTVSHQGVCSIRCFNDEQCVSFTFHSIDKICQGHSENYADLYSVSYLQEIGSDYFMEG